MAEAQRHPERMHVKCVYERTYERGVMTRSMWKLGEKMEGHRRSVASHGAKMCVYK